MSFRKLNKWLRRYWTSPVSDAGRVMNVEAVRYYVRDEPLAAVSYPQFGNYVWLEAGDLLRVGDYLWDESTGAFHLVKVATNAEMRVLEARRAMRYVGP